jgi:protein TonB
VAPAFYHHLQQNKAMKRNTISGLARHYGRNWLVGLLSALSVVYLAVNAHWNVDENVTAAVLPAWEEEAAEIIRTYHPPERKPIPPPEKISSIIEPVDDQEPIAEPEPKAEPITNPSTEPVLVGVSPKPMPAPPPLPPPPSPKEEAPMIFVEVMPRFPGCEDMEGTREEKTDCANQQLLAFVMRNLKYPRAALENDIEGTVVVQFIVEKDGSITGAEVLKGIGGGCGEEALRVVREMPKWRPGIQQGRKVRVSFRLPIRFQMN